MSQAGTPWDGEVLCGQGPCQASSASGGETQMARQENDGKLGAGPPDDCAGTQGWAASEAAFVSWSRGNPYNLQEDISKDGSL